MRRYTIEVDGTPYEIDVQEDGAGRFRARVGDTEFEVLLSDGAALPEAVVTPALMPALPTVPQNGARPRPEPAAPPPAPRAVATLGGAGRLAVAAPLPGVVESILVKPGERVERGQPLLVLEAMKMRNTIRASEGGVVAELLAQPGKTVQQGEALLLLDRGAP